MTELSRSYEEPSRGRPRGKSNSHDAPLKSIFLIARKYDLNPNLLVEAFVEAWRNKISHYQSLMISCREVNQGFVTFLITKEKKVVSQFPIELEIIRNPDFLKTHIQNIPISNYAKGKVVQKHRKIEELRFGMRGVDIKAKIIEKTPRKLVITRLGTEAYVSNVRIDDETGTIKLSLWNNQIDMVHIGDEVEINNCYVSSFLGESQLRIGRKGVISIINQPPTI